ncbi:hypothetical protein QD409_33645 [Rhizobium sp. BR 315]
MNAQPVRETDKVGRHSFRLQVRGQITVRLRLTNGPCRGLSPSHEIALKLLPQISFSHAFGIEKEEDSAQRKPTLVQGNAAFEDLLEGSDALQRIYNARIMFAKDFGGSAQSAKEKILTIFEVVADDAGGPSRTIRNLPDGGRRYAGLRDDIQ